MEAVTPVSRVQIIQPPKRGGSPRARSGQTSCCLPYILGGKHPRRQSPQEKIIKKLDRGGHVALGLLLDKQPPPRAHCHMASTAALRYTPSTTCGHREAGAGPQKVKIPSGHCVGASPVQLLLSGPEQWAACPTPRPFWSLFFALFSASLTPLLTPYPVSLCPSVPLLISHL